MRGLRFYISAFLTALLLVSFTGCGKETVSTVAPFVVSTTPVNGATGVAVTVAPTATFSVGMNPNTINTSTFKLTGPGGAAVAGTVTYVSGSSVATFTPSASLAYNTLYTATITTGVSDTIGDQPAANYVWSFTTATQPTVLSVVPANGTINVPRNQVLTATFSKPMNAATITSSTFLLTSASGSVSGVVTYNATGSIATFTPSANLAYNTVYTATITTGVTDTTGDPMAANYVWSFTTVAQPTVVSVVPTNGAINIPIAQVLTATFSKAMNAATITSSTFLLSSPSGSVSGVVTYNASGSIATFTPSANLAYNTLYTATITTGVTDTSGNPMAANYVWSFTTTGGPTVIATTPTNGATGLPINQVVSATFSRAMNCATLATPATSFTLTGPGTTPIAGVVTCAGSVATFTPSSFLTLNTLYTATISTAATDTGGAPLAANYVWAFRTAPTATPPTVISTVPVNGATGVAVNQAVSATWSEAMNPATINGTTFTLKAGSVAVAGTVTYVAAGSVATFTPTAALTASTLYTATVTTGSQDLNGNSLVTNFVWTFTTAVAPDTTRPTVISTIPANAATAVPLNQAISATFSEAMNAATITSSTFTVTGPSTTVTGAVTYAAIGHQAIFTPTANLAASTLYVATITTGVTDLAGNALLVNYTWSFTTGPAPDTTNPQIVSTAPVNGAVNVAVNQAVSATFTEAMNPLTITTGTYTLTGPGAVLVPATVTYDAVNFIATLTPTASLTASTSYTANVSTAATDVAGNALGNTGAPNPWTFTTGTTVLPPPVDLKTAISFGGFGGDAGITNQGIYTVVNGNIGTTGVSTLITGFHDNGAGCVYTETPLNIGYVNGSIDTAPPPPTVGCPTEGTAVTQAIAAQAALDALAAYNAMAALPNGLDVSVCPGCGGGSAGELGNRTLAAGTYKSAPGSFAISQGDLTLDAKGDPNAYWVFQMGTSLTVGTPTFHRSVLLVNGAQAKNVFWQVGTAATINGVLGGGTMVGTIISQSGISVSTAGVVAITTVNGRLIVLTGPVTMVNTVVNVPAP